MYLKLGLALLVIFGGRQCDFNINNLNDLVVSYEITFVNAGPGDAVAGIFGKDVKRRAILAAGASTTITSFGGGSVLISASPAADVLAQLNARRDQITATLDAKPLDLAQSLSVYNQLNAINAEIRAYESAQHGSLCSVQLKTDPKGKGTNVSVTATFDGSRWQLACS